MTGTEKQISYATDILTNPYATMGANAKLRDRTAALLDKTSKKAGDRERKVADAFRAAQKRWAAETAKLPDMPASKIIEKRSALDRIAYNILRDEYKKRGFDPLDAPRHLF